MTPKATEASGVSAIYELLRYAAARTQPVAATYDGHLDCFALMLGGENQAACMSAAISSEEVVIVEPRAPEGRGVWRCLAVEKLSQVELRTDAWHTEPRSPQQTCIDEVDFDTDAQSGDDPQKGQ
jgi:hypothetical protein